MNCIKKDYEHLESSAFDFAALSFTTNYDALFIYGFIYAVLKGQNTKYIYNFQKKINVNDIIEMVGLSTNEELESIWNKIKNNSISTLISVVRDINNFGININQFLIFLKDKNTNDKKYIFFL